MKGKGCEATTSMMKNAFEILKTTASKLDKQPSQPDEVSSFFTYVSSKVKKNTPFKRKKGFSMPCLRY